MRKLSTVGVGLGAFFVAGALSACGGSEARTCVVEVTESHSSELEVGQRVHLDPCPAVKYYSDKGAGVVDIDTVSGSAQGLTVVTGEGAPSTGGTGGTGSGGVFTGAYGDW